jgi:hypothetical protein
LHHKWHRLGREAFLAHESQSFDRMYANPSSLMHVTLIWLVMALPVFVIYKGIAFVIFKSLSAISNKEETLQG